MKVLQQNYIIPKSKKLEHQEVLDQMAKTNMQIKISHFVNKVPFHTDQLDIITIPTTGLYPPETKPTSHTANAFRHIGMTGEVQTATMNGPDTLAAQSHTTAIKSKTQNIASRKLPKFLLSNIQSFGSTENTDKTTEVEAVLDLNDIDIATLTETWLTENNKEQINFNNYVNFHSIRKTP